MNDIEKQFRLEKVKGDKEMNKEKIRKLIDKIIKVIESDDSLSNNECLYVLVGCLASICVDMEPTIIKTAYAKRIKYLLDKFLTIALTQPKKIKEMNFE